MSPRFNTKSNGTKATNLAGGTAYRESAKLELASILLTSFVQDQHYRSADDTLTRLKDLITALPDKQFAAKAAIYARTKYGMRSISHVVAAEIAKQVKGEQWTRPFFDAVVHRADDITEILAYYTSAYGKPIPNSLKDGLARAIARHDAYALGKYRGEGHAFKMVDAVNLLHPKPSDKSAEGLHGLVEGTLRSVDTWETKLTQAGQQAEGDDDKLERKAEAWKELIATRKLGYFALLRNLRNILEQAPDVLDEALAMLTDEALIKKSLVLPFRFYSAYVELRQTNGSGKLLGALSKALDLSLQNLPTLPGKTLVVIDHSGSMESQNGKGKYTHFQIGALLGTALAKTQGADVLYFGDIAKYYSINPVDSTLSIVEALEGLNNAHSYSYNARGEVQLASTNVGHGTNFPAIFETAAKAYDRIIILSDMQSWEGGPTPSSLADYESSTGAKPFLYSIDLAGYGSLQFPQERVFTMAGFSEKLFELMPKLESDKNALVNEIEAVSL